MIYCPNCLMALNDSDTICPACKAKVGEGNTPDALAGTLEKNTVERLDETRLVDDPSLADSPNRQERSNGHPIADNGMTPWSIAPGPSFNDAISPSSSRGYDGIRTMQVDQGAGSQPIAPQTPSKSQAGSPLKDDAPIIVAIIIALIIIAIAGFAFFTKEDKSDQAGENTTIVETSEQTSTGENSSASRSSDSDNEGASTTTTG